MNALRAQLNLNKYYYLCCLIAVILPWNWKGIGAAIILLVLTWILEGRFRQKAQLLVENKTTLLHLSFFLLFVVGLTYSENLNKGFSTLTKELSLFIFPLVLSTIPPLDKAQKQRIFLFFAVSCILASLACLFFAFYKFYHELPLGVSVYGGHEATQEFYRTHPETSKIWAYITYSELVAGINSHPTYFSIFCIFALNYLITDFLRRSVSTGKKVVAGILVVYLLGFTLLLSSRIGVLIVSILPFFYLLQLNISRIRLFLSGIMVLLVLAGTIWLIPVLKNRLVTELLKFKFEIPRKAPDLLAQSSSKTKFINWFVSYEVVRENPLFGVGTGDYQDEMDEVYQRHGYEVANLNAHNQFLQTTIMFGLLGLTIFCSILFLSVYQSIIRRDFLFIIFIFSFILLCLPESVLMRQQGIVYYCLFNSIFLFHGAYAPLQVAEIRKDERITA